MRAKVLPEFWFGCDHQRLALVLGRILAIVRGGSTGVWEVVVPLPDPHVNRMSSGTHYEDWKHISWGALVGVDSFHRVNIV